MSEPQPTDDGWWARLDAGADTAAIWAALLCAVILLVHIRTHPRGFRNRRVVGACLAGAAVSIAYRWFT